MFLNVYQSVETAVQRSKYLFKIYHNILYTSKKNNFPEDDTTDLYSLKIMSELSTRLKHFTATDIILHRFNAFITLNVFCKVEQCNWRIFIFPFWKSNYIVFMSFQQNVATMWQQFLFYFVKNDGQRLFFRNQ